MRAIAVFGVVAAVMTAGCASVQETASGAERDFSGYARRVTPSVRVGEAHVVEARIRPELPLGGAQASRAQLDGGRFIVCWTRGSIEQGRRALAQAFRANGTPLGAPVVISPPNVDVVGAPTAIATDGQHAIATFAAASGASIDLLGVPMETPDPSGSQARTAQR